jgi:hypothetical protein
MSSPDSPSSTLPQDPVLVSVRIPSFDKAVDENGKHYYKYFIITTSKAPEKEWTIERRFCNFYDLFNGLSEARKLKMKFPSPSLLQFSLSQYDLASSRIKKLEKFLNELVKTKDLTEIESSLLYDFLDAGDHHFINIGRPHSESRTISISPPVGMLGDSDASDSGLEEEGCLSLSSPAAPVALPAAGFIVGKEAVDDNILSSRKGRQPSFLHYVDIDDENEMPSADATIGAGGNILYAAAGEEEFEDVPARPGSTNKNSNESAGSSSLLWPLGLVAIGGIVAMMYIRNR